MASWKKDRASYTSDAEEAKALPRNCFHASQKATSFSLCTTAPINHGHVASPRYRMSFEDTYIAASSSREQFGWDLKHPTICPWCLGSKHESPRHRVGNRHDKTRNRDTRRMRCRDGFYLSEPGMHLSSGPKTTTTTQSTSPSVCGAFCALHTLRRAKRLLRYTHRSRTC